ncbi:MAG: hypothetical protein KIT34_11600 [Cyanobacteria bacterium TGS_CYA1]|nr:hypothetical protein [Cyanobacteria bacterium TGS_CYA1]
MKFTFLSRSILCSIASAQILLLSGCGGMLFEEFRQRGEFLGSSSSLSFDSKFWKKDKKMRSQMCSMLPIKLKGLKDTQVEEMLGPPDERSGQDPKLKEPDCMAYEMQDKKGKTAMYLLVFLTDRVVDKVEMGLPK